MAVGRWMLLALMVLAGPLLWWAGVADTTTAAYAAVAPGDADGRYFISNYDGPGRTIAGFFAFFNLLLIAVLMPTARQLHTMRPGTFVRAGVTAVLALGLAWFEFVFDPVTANWGGDPDAWSMVDDHVASWYDGFATTWFALTAATSAAIATAAFAAALWAARARRRRAVR
ncbi:hypothetical protein [Actinoplanes sp. GCM10030250]|uniref:hypothetical protein n=1 Tax=Actinoplanes sp. GCM10030250 TaxID=3273376 RepID=UPI00360C86CB